MTALSQQSGVAAAPVAPEEERVIFTVRPTMLFVYVWYVVAAVMVIAAAALMGILNSQFEVSGWVAFLVIAAVGLVAFAIPIYKHILRRREVYVLTNHKLEMRYGLIAKTVQNTPINKIQEVTVTASVLQRFLNLGDVRIESASATGLTRLLEVHHPQRYADMIMAELRRRNL